MEHRTPANAPFSAINVVPGSLSLACLKRDKIAEVSHALLNVFLFSSAARFFSFVHTSDEITMILEPSMLGMFPKDSITVYGEKWRGLKIILGSCGYSESGIISKLSKILSDNNINIHYLPTYSTDYILIPEQKLVKALRCLRQRNVDVSWDEGENIELKAVPLVSTETPVKTTIANQKLVMLPTKFSLASLKKEDYPSCTQAILRFVFFPKGENSFFSYTEAEDEISLIMDSESAQDLKSLGHNILIEQDHWYAVKRHEKLSLDEVGVVHAISRPLCEAGISLLYLSTYCSSFIMVRENKFQSSLSILRNHSFDVYVGEA
jgi:hypothetical protein